MLRRPLFVQSNRSRRNSFLAGLQALIGAVAIFFTYRFLVSEVGMEVFGLWSVLLAGASVARLADVSGSSGLSRFVAERLAEDQVDDSVTFVHTTVLATLGFSIVGSLLVLVFSGPLIQWLAPEQQANTIIGLMPLALLVSLVLPSVSTTICSGLDGAQRADIRAVLMAGSYAVMLGATLVLVTRWGIYGFVAALVIQHLVIAVAAWTILRRLLPGLGWFPFRWSRHAFRESFTFGLQVQATSFAGLLSDPLARVLMAWWGGVAAAGAYELAMRLLTQMRSPIVAALQPIVPAAAALGGERERVAKLVSGSVRHVLKAGIAFPAVAIAAAPLYSHFMLGRSDRTLEIFIALLAVGYAANLTSVPFFFGAMGLGAMRWNLASQFVMAGFIALLGNLGGWLGGSIGVVLAQVAGLLAGAVTVVLGNANELGLGHILRREAPRLVVLMSSIAGAALLGAGSIFWAAGY